MKYLSILALAQVLALAQPTTIDYPTQISRKPFEDIRLYSWVRVHSGSGLQSVSGTLTSTGSHTLTFPFGPMGLSSSRGYVYIFGGTGTAEAVPITATTCPLEWTTPVTSCTVTVTTANTHSGAWSVGTATSGIEECVRVQGRDGKSRYCYVPPGTYGIHAAVRISSGPMILEGITNASILEVPAGEWDYDARWWLLDPAIGASNEKFPVVIGAVATTPSDGLGRVKVKGLTILTNGGSQPLDAPTNYFTNEIGFYKCSACSIEENLILGSQHTGPTIASQGAGDRTVIKGNVSRGNCTLGSGLSAGQGPGGIFWHGASVVVRDNYLDGGCDEMIVPNGSTLGVATDFLIENNTIGPSSGATGGVHIENTGHGQVVNNHCRGGMNAAGDNGYSLNSCYAVWTTPGAVGASGNVSFAGNDANGAAAGYDIYTSNPLLSPTSISISGGEVWGNSNDGIQISSNGAGKGQIDFATTDVNATDNTITITTHPFVAEEIVRFTTTGGLPAGLSAGVDYYIISPTANTFKVSTTLNGPEVDITDQGTGTHSVTWDYTRVGQIVIEGVKIHDNGGNPAPAGAFFGGIRLGVTQGTYPAKLIIKGNIINHNGSVADGSGSGVTYENAGIMFAYFTPGNNIYGGDIDISDNIITDTGTPKVQDHAISIQDFMNVGQQALRFVVHHNIASGNLNATLVRYFKNNVGFIAKMSDWLPYLSNSIFVPNITDEFSNNIKSDFFLQFTELGVPANGSKGICYDCTVTGAGDNTCAGGGTGAFAVRLNDVWRCFNAQN